MQGRCIEALRQSLAKVIARGVARGREPKHSPRQPSAANTITTQTVLGGTRELSVYSIVRSIRLTTQLTLPETQPSTISRGTHCPPS